MFIQTFSEYGFSDFKTLFFSVSRCIANRVHTICFFCRYRRYALFVYIDDLVDLFEKRNHFSRFLVLAFRMAVTLNGAYFCTKPVPKYLTTDICLLNVYQLGFSIISFISIALISIYLLYKCR